MNNFEQKLNSSEKEPTIKIIKSGEADNENFKY